MTTPQGITRSQTAGTSRSRLRAALRLRGYPLAFLLSLVGAGCVRVPAGVIEGGSQSSFGDLVVLNRHVPLYLVGLPECDFRFVRATAAEFDYAASPRLLVRMTLQNDTLHPVASGEFEVRGFDLGEQEVTTHLGPAPMSIGARSVAGVSWSTELAAAAHVARATVELTAVTYTDGTTCRRSSTRSRAEPVPLAPATRPVPQATAPPARRDEALAWAQARLNTWGFECGPTDGLSGPRTRACIRAFQSQEGYPATGELDAIVWDLLRTDPSGPAAFR